MSHSGKTACCSTSTAAAVVFSLESHAFDRFRVGKSLSSRDCYLAHEHLHISLLKHSLYMIHTIHSVITHSLPCLYGNSYSRPRAILQTHILSQASPLSSCKQPETSSAKDASLTYYKAASAVSTMSVPSADDRSVRDLISRSIQLAIGSGVQTRRQTLPRTAAPLTSVRWQALSFSQIRLRLYAVATIAPTPLGRNSSTSTDEAENECGICLDRLFQTGDDAFVVIRLNACRHAFHERCVLNLLDWDQRNRVHRDIRHARCPLCRTNLFHARPNSGENAAPTGPREHVPPTRPREMMQYASFQTHFVYRSYGMAIPRHLYGTSFPYPSQRRYTGTRYASAVAESRSSIPHPRSFSRASSSSEPTSTRSVSWADYFPSVESRNQVYMRPRLSLPLPYGNVHDIHADHRRNTTGSFGRYAGDAEPVPS
jgi:hypothetical protein